MECCYNCYVIFTQCRFDVQSFKHWKYSFLDILMLIVVLNSSEFPDLSRHAMVSTHKITTVHREWHFQDCLVLKSSPSGKNIRKVAVHLLSLIGTLSRNALFCCNDFFLFPYYYSEYWHFIQTLMNVAQAIPGKLKQTCHLAFANTQLHVFMNPFW